MARIGDLPRNAPLNAIYARAGEIFEELVRRDPQTDYTKQEAFNTAIWYIAQDIQSRGFIALASQSTREIASGIGNYTSSYKSRIGPSSLKERDVRYSEIPDQGLLSHIEVVFSHIPIRIVETPLTAHNLTTIASLLTELSTKYWLIAKGRFADLIEYTQTRNSYFAEQANLVITRITYNSPMNMVLKVDLSAPSVADALITTIDGITQTPTRLEQKKLENQAKAQELLHAEQLSAHERQMALLEQEQSRLEIERQRLELLEKQLDVQKKEIEYALEIAGKVVDLLHPGADPATRAMQIQALLPNLVQLQNGKGLELALPPGK